MTTRTTAPQPNTMPSGPTEEDGTATYTTGTQPSEGFPGGEGTQVPSVSGSGSYIDPATGTVAGQMDKILAKQGPLMQRAANFQDVGTQRAGLLGSSMASGARMGAMIDRAMPMAQQDASTYAGLAANQQKFDMENSMNATLHGYQKEMMDKEWDLNTRTMAMGFMDSMSRQFMENAAGLLADENVTQEQVDSFTNAFDGFMEGMFTMVDYDDFEWGTTNL